MRKQLYLAATVIPAAAFPIAARRRKGSMKTLLGGLAVISLLCAGAHAATVNTTLTINGSGTSTAGSISATGTASFTGGLTGTGTFSSSFALASALGGSVPISLTVTAGSTTGTLTGTFSASLTLLAEVFIGSPSASGPGTIAITSGTGGFAGTTGSFNVTAAGTGAGTTSSGAGTFTLIGPGTLNIGGGTTGPAAPTVTKVLNNYSRIPNGFPNYGVAPGALFIVQGTGLADPNAVAVLQSSAAPGIPTTLNGASISVTVGGTTVHPGIYYACGDIGCPKPDVPASQVAAVLPANTPTGTGTITMSYNGTPSATFPIQVVPAALGLATYNGLASATNPTTGALYTYTNSIKPGDIIVLWGSGLGAISADSDTVFSTTPHAAAGTLQIYIGGIAANVLYAGDSGYPGVNQIDVTVPTSVSTGCNVSLVAVSGSGSNLVTSNPTAVAISATGGVCSDPAFGTNGTTTTTLSGQTTVKTGSLFLLHSVSPGTTAGTTQTNDLAEAGFQNTTGASYTSSGSQASLGSCAVSETVTGSTSTVTTVGLNPGTVSVSGPAGSQTLATPPGGISPRIFIADLPTGFIPASGGVFTFTGTGGPDVGSFSSTLTFPNPLLTWTNQSAGAAISRSVGVTVNWTGGAAGSYVVIGGSSANSTSGISGSFSCFAPVAALTFTVPNFILLNLPAGTGSLDLENTTAWQSFTATGIDHGYSFGATFTSINSTYN